MSYAPRPRQPYHVRRMRQMISASPQHHLAFRNEWESNFDKAYHQALALKSQGYLVDEGLRRGAIMESEAKRLAAAYKRGGCEVQLIPIARWGNERVVFLVHKPPKGAEPSPTTPSKPKEPTVKEVEHPPEKVIEMFVASFRPAPNQPDNPQKLHDRGYLIDKDRFIGLIDPDSPCTEPLVEMAREARARTATAIIIPNTPSFRKLLASKARDYPVVTIDQAGNKGLNVERLVKALRVLGDGYVKLEPFSDQVLKPAYLFKDKGYAISIAPIADPSDPKLPMDTVISEFKGKAGTS